MILRVLLLFLLAISHSFVFGNSINHYCQKHFKDDALNEPIRTHFEELAISFSKNGRPDNPYNNDSVNEFCESLDSTISKVKTLSRYNIEVTSLLFLSFFKNLRSLHLIDLSPISKSIKELDIETSLKNLSKLEILRLNYLSLTENQLNFLMSLKKLKELDLSDNNIADISFLKNAKQIKRLELRNNLITNINNIPRLKKLELINLRGNNIDDYSILDDFPRLRTMYLD